MTATTPVSTANKISINTPDGPIMAEDVCDGSEPLHLTHSFQVELP